MKHFLLFLFIAGLTEQIYSQNPTYQLTARNFTYTAQNTMEFDIFMKHANNPTAYEYSGGQYFLNFNPVIANGGTLT